MNVIDYLKIYLLKRSNNLLNYMNIVETTAGVLIAIVIMLVYEKAKDWYEQYQYQKRRRG